MREWKYDIRCRRCGKIKEIYHSNEPQVTKESFLKWVSEACAYPKQHQCSCDNGRIMLHDLISHNAIH